MELDNGSAEFDVVVLGLGPGGEHAAGKLSRAGLRVAGVEAALVGGECPFWACTPSKLMVRPAGTLGEARRVDRLAGSAEVRPDWAKVAARIRESNHDWHDAQHVQPLEDAGMQLVRGHGRLAGPGVVEVDTDDGAVRLTATRGVVLNTGTEPRRPDVDGLEGTPYWTNREAMKVTEVPDRLVVMGGGPNGVELAQVFARFGATVTVLHTGDHLLGRDEPEAGAALAEVFRDEGIEVRTGVETQRVSHDGDTFTVRVSGSDLHADRLLVATGRSNNLADIGLETVGLDPETDTLEVDDRLRAGERLWALGDIAGRGAFTHVSIYQADVAVRDILGEEGPPADYRGLSHVTFTDPEVAAVGLTEAAARGRGIDVRTGYTDLSDSSRGWIHDPDATGFVKVVADAERDVLVGATVVAPYGGEVLGLLVTAVHAQVPLPTLRSMHYAFPTFHRAVATALSDL